MLWCGEALLMLTKDGQKLYFLEKEPKYANSIFDQSNSIWDQYWFEALIQKTTEQDTPTEYMTVGYIKIGWIRKSVWNTRAFNLWHFASISGWTIAEAVNQLPHDMKDWTAEQKAALVNAADGYFHWYYTQGGQNPITPENVDAIWENINKSLKAKLGGKYKKFKMFNMDRPIVDYISTEKSMLRQHVGLAMYQFVAKWVNDKFGLHLYASDTQTDTAEFTWKKMEEMGWVVYNKKGKYIRLDIA